eukprot:NODE_675_length_4834_cov_0.216895.p1 type:complete len:721 gc:universal NODE_675_length_4834_cov_0.216895:2047-4209(+)
MGDHMYPIYNEASAEWATPPCHVLITTETDNVKIAEFENDLPQSKGLFLIYKANNLQSLSSLLEFPADTKLIYTYSFDGDTKNVYHFKDLSIPIVRSWLADNCYIVIIGEPINLEEEIRDDLIVLCSDKLANLNDVEFNHLIQKINLKLEEQQDENNEIMDDDMNHCVYNLFTESNNNLHVLINPSIEQFQYHMKLQLELGLGRKFKMFYSGHGTEDGELLLREAFYSGEDFKTFLKSLKMKHTPNLSILINSCFSMSFIEKVTGIVIDFDSFFKNLLSLSDQQMKQFNAKTYLENKEMSAKVFTKLVELFGNNRSLFRKQVGQTMLYFIPTSKNGELKSSGLLSEIYFNQEGVDKLGSRSTTNINKYKNFCTTMKKKYKKLPVPVKPILKKITYPTVHIFKAENGDSCLFKFNKWNILIDGGLIPKSGSKIDIKTPCFYEKVKHLKKLDCVILTHGDADHINGLVALVCMMKRISLEIPEFYLNTLRKYYCRNYIHAYILSEMLKKEKTVKMRKNEMFQKEDGNDKLYIHFVSPTKENFTKMQNAMKVKVAKSAGKPNTHHLKLDDTIKEKGDINETGIVVWIHCVKSKTRWNLLFTGDAKGKQIVEDFDAYLKKLKEDDTYDAVKYKSFSQIVFDYMDAPHHGSEENELFDLIDNAKTIKHLSFSTDGSIYGHPSVNMAQVVNKNNIEKIYFNYEEQRNNFDESPKFVFEQETISLKK